MNDLVSIIIPIYNVEKYIHRCVDSIMKQSYSNIEIILVDDGSKDKSGSICDEYVKKDNRIKIIHKNNAGLGYARNSGLDIASGKFVTFVDGDDYLGENHIKNMLSLLISTGTDTCIAGHTKVFTNRHIEHKNVCAGEVFIENIKNNILNRMCGADEKGEDYIEMSVCMALLSNEIIRENHLRFVSEREYVSEDLVFDFDYYPLSSGVCVSDSVDYYYCDNEGSLTTKYRKDRFDSQIKMYNMLSSKANEIGIFECCKLRLQNTIIAIARYCIKLEYKFETVNGKQIAQANVRKICENQILSKILSEYDDRLIKKSSRIVNFLIRKKMYFMLKFAMWIKNRFNV